MKVYKVELLIIDEDTQDIEEITSLIENQRYPNWSLNPTVMDIKEAEIGEWHDDQPLNFAGKRIEEYNRLFKTDKQ
jgi:hypothetical protein